MIINGTKKQMVAAIKKNAKAAGHGTLTRVTWKDDKTRYTCDVCGACAWIYHGSSPLHASHDLENSLNVAECVA